MTLQENLRAFMRDFFRVLNSEEFRKLPEFLAQPSELLIKDGRVQLRSPSDMVTAFSMAARVHFQRNVRHIRRNVDLVHVTGLEEAIICVSEQAHDARGDVILRWHSSFLLKRTNGIWRILSANARNHDVAWQRLGQPSLQAASESSLC